jgi:hypothetical protein
MSLSAVWLSDEKFSCKKMLPSSITADHKLGPFVMSMTPSVTFKTSMLDFLINFKFFTLKCRSLFENRVDAVAGGDNPLEMNEGASTNVVKLSRAQFVCDTGLVGKLTQFCIGSAVNFNSESSFGRVTVENFLSLELTDT